MIGSAIRGITVGIKPKLHVGAEDSTIIGIEVSWQSPRFQLGKHDRQSISCYHGGTTTPVSDDEFGFHSALDDDLPSTCPRSDGTEHDFSTMLFFGIIDIRKKAFPLGG